MTTFSAHSAFCVFPPLSRVPFQFRTGTSNTALFRAPDLRNSRPRFAPLCTSAPEAPPVTPHIRKGREPSTVVPFAPEWHYIGTPLSAGSVPAVLYFALSAEHSLHEAPYNEFATALVARSSSIRIYSVTLPFHGRSLAENAAAFSEWARVYVDGGDVVSRFSRMAAAFADELVARGLAPSGAVFSAGLSRGGLMAAHVAMRASCIRGLIAFAPVVVLADLPEFSDAAMDSDGARGRVGRASLLQERAIARLAEIPVRFYMGNFDRRVGTRNAFELTHALAQKAVLDGGVRSPPHEFIMYCSVGKEGHGTPRDVFQDGAKWILEQMKQLYSVNGMNRDADV